MLVFHGSYTKIEQIDLNLGRKQVDFGIGFYTTTLREQAEKWALNVTCNSAKMPIVNVYDFKDSDRLLHKVFDGYSREWLEFVIFCRTNEVFSFAEQFDVIFGNIADDRVMEEINRFIELWKLGRADELAIANTLRQLSYQDENNQYCFKTAKSLDYVQFVEAYKVKP
jgi:hypothetical protein